MNKTTIGPTKQFPGKGKQVGARQHDIAFPISPLSGLDLVLFLSHFVLWQVWRSLD